MQGLQGRPSAPPVCLPPRRMHAEELRRSARFVLLSFPSRRYNQSTDMVSAGQGCGGSSERANSHLRHAAGLPGAAPPGACPAGACQRPQRAPSAALLHAGDDSSACGLPFEQVPELLELGGALFGALEAAPQRVAVVVSADLAHTHAAASAQRPPPLNGRRLRNGRRGRRRCRCACAFSAHCPTRAEVPRPDWCSPRCMQDGPYGFSEDAAPYDNAVAAWVERLQPARLLRDAKRRQAGGAKSCGFTGLVLLQGLLQAALSPPRHRQQGPVSGGAADGSSLRAAWDSQLLAIHHPTYFGMAVARFQRRPDAGGATA